MGRGNLFPYKPRENSKRKKNHSAMPASTTSSSSELKRTTKFATKKRSKHFNLVNCCNKELQKIVYKIFFI